MMLFSFFFLGIRMGDSEKWAMASWEKTHGEKGSGGSMVSDL
jgi:hypothetical protein